MTLPLERLKELRKMAEPYLHMKNKQPSATETDINALLDWAISITEDASRAPETAEAVAAAVETQWQKRITGPPISLRMVIGAALQREREIAEVRLAEERECVSAALEFAERYGSIDGDHHKMWVIDQMVRALTGADYAKWVKEQKEGEDGPDTYDWSEGIPP